MLTLHDAPTALEGLEPRLLLSGALIVTSEALAGAFQEVADWYTRKGYPAEVVTTASIQANYPGADSQERIRNCIADYHENRDVLYVLLGGDETVVPVRDAGGWGGGNMPADLYYSSLDGQWDADADGIFGEADGDNVNFDYETIVGRYPVRTAGQVEDLLAKVVAYETSPPQADWATDMLAVGTTLWNIGDAENKSINADGAYVRPYWAGRNLDMFFDSGTSWDLARPGDYLLDSDNLLEVMGNGYQFMHMASHGATSSWPLESGRFGTDTISGMTGSFNVPIVSTIACDTGAFDAGDSSLSEAFLRSDKTGTIIYIGSSREGWDVPNMTLGPSFQWSYMFYKKFLIGSTQIAGEVFAETKAAFAAMSGHEGATRWLQFSINLQGDPLVQMYRDDPVTLGPAFMTEIAEGDQTYQVTALPAGARVVLWQGEQVYEVGSADYAGTFSTSISPQAGAMKITAIAPDAAVFTGEVTVVEAEFYVPPPLPEGPEMASPDAPGGEETFVASFDRDAAFAAAVLTQEAGNDASVAVSIRAAVEGSAPARRLDVESHLTARDAVDAEEDGQAPAELATEAAARPARRLADNDDGTEPEGEPQTPVADGSDVTVRTETSASVDLAAGWDLDAARYRAAA